MSALERIATAAGVTLFDWQVAAIHAAVGQPGLERLCLYHRTGAGKTLTSLLAVAQWGWDDAVVIAPPATHAAWEVMGKRVGVDVVCMSHAKFRMKDTKLSRKLPVIADEFHMFGGHGGQGWKKLEGLAGGLQAPLVMASATPNYNDADRVYCIQRILDRHSCKGGFLQFLYNNCELEHDPFSATPKVIGFLNHKDAEAYLASLPGVAYLPDDLVWSITDVPFSTPTPMAYEVFGYNERKHRLVASIMEDRHTRTFMARVDGDGLIHDHVFEKVLDLIEDSSTPVLVYCNHATIAVALYGSLGLANMDFELVTGDASKNDKERAISRFRRGLCGVLVGTATLATGTDGLDKVCDRLIILDDTDDDSLRRQLVGRIMPRGEDSDASKKQVFRLLQQ
jgi:hypothetical protein